MIPILLAILGCTIRGTGTFEPENDACEDACVDDLDACEEDCALTHEGEGEAAIESCRESCAQDYEECTPNCP
jgi:hypothetical protein